MTRARLFVRRLLARLLRRWEEGPEPPRRIAEEVRLFRHHYPDASHGEWERFAVRLAGNAYRDAFVRGFEWNERCWPERTIDGQAVAVVHATDRSLGAGEPRVRRLLDDVPTSMSAEQRRLIDELAASPWGVRIRFEE